MSMTPEDLPGSRACVGCHGLTFRSRGDGLCPRCAFNAESLIEQVELDALDRDLQLMTQFEAYYQARDLRRSQSSQVVTDLEGLPQTHVRRPFAGLEPFSLFDDAGAANVSPDHVERRRRA